MKDLLPPLVVKLREEIKSWRDSGYVGASINNKVFTLLVFN